MTTTLFNFLLTHFNSAIIWGGGAWMNCLLPSTQWARG